MQSEARAGQGAEHCRLIAKPQSERRLALVAAGIVLFGAGLVPAADDQQCFEPWIDDCTGYQLCYTASDKSFSWSYQNVSVSSFIYDVEPAEGFGFYNQTWINNIKANNDVCFTYQNFLLYANANCEGTGELIHTSRQPINVWQATYGWPGGSFDCSGD
jgi:hypothetical protein